MKKMFGRVLFAISFLSLTSCGVHTNGAKATDGLAEGEAKTVAAGAVCGAQGRGCAVGDSQATEQSDTSDGSSVSSTSKASTIGAAGDQAVAPAGIDESHADGGDSGKASNVDLADAENAQNAENAASNADDLSGITAGGITDDMFVKCEARIGKDGKFYTAQAVGPTIEEARENAVAEACSIPCAEELEEQGIADDELEKLIDDCAETCSDEGLVVAAICFREGVTIYTEGGWNENGDPAPTNGSETPK